MPVIQPSVDDAAAAVSPPAPRSALFFDGIDWRVARVSATGYLEVDVLTSALPAGAATAAAQALALAELQTIAEIRDALQSVATDRLIVRGEDQVFTIKQILASRTTGIVSGADGFLETGGATAGEYGVILNIVAWDATSATTAQRFDLRHGVGGYYIYNETRAIPAGEPIHWGGKVILEGGDSIRVNFTGALAGDTCGIDLTGYRMTLET